MASGSSELLLDPLQELRRKKLTELAQTRKRVEQKSRKEQIWFYATLLFAMATVTTGTSLLFLVPLYVDPAISTLIADFVPRPVTCVTTRRYDYSGLFNCTWSSCREGCTSDFYRCTHIYVEYAEQTDANDADDADDVDDEEDPADPADHQASSVDELSQQQQQQQQQQQHHHHQSGAVRQAVLLVNIKGCGYPPSVRCANFTAKYGQLGYSFPCYYSRQNKTVAMNRYDRSEQVRTIVNFFVLPFVVCVISSVTLCVMHCDCKLVPKTPPESQQPAASEEPNRTLINMSEEIQPDNLPPILNDEIDLNDPYALLNKPEGKNEVPDLPTEDEDQHLQTDEEDRPVDEPGNVIPPG